MMFFLCGAAVGVVVAVVAFLVVSAFPHVKVDEVDRETVETEAGRGPLPWEK